jgi:uncharacterized protein (DUF433 family)
MGPAKGSETHITKTAGVCGGDACIRNTRITIAGLVAWRKHGLTDSEIREHVPDVTPDDLRAAWAYYAEHRAEIDQTIKENETA